MIVDLYLVYSFIKRLTTPFTEWPAFTLGIIDADGNILKKRSTLTGTEKDAFGVYDLMILRLKKLLAKVPGGQSRISSYAAALWLIKESKNLGETIDDLSDEILEESFNSYLDYTQQHYDVNQKFEKMLEDAAVNSAGSGAIAGIGVGPQGEPGVSKAAQRRIQKKNREMAGL
jgi:hypothetical protein